MQSCKQTLALLRQDKEYLNRQLTEVMTKSKVFEEQTTVLNQELGKIKQDREELYEKYISVRYRIMFFLLLVLKNLHQCIY